MHQISSHSSWTTQTFNLFFRKEYVTTSKAPKIHRCWRPASEDTRVKGSSLFITLLALSPGCRAAKGTSKSLLSLPQPWLTQEPQNLVPIFATRSRKHLSAVLLPQTSPQCPLRLLTRHFRGAPFAVGDTPGELWRSQWGPGVIQQLHIYAPEIYRVLM